MFGLFGTSVINDPDLGELKRSRGMWRGCTNLHGKDDVPLIIAGSRSAPDSDGVKAVKLMLAQYAASKSQVEVAFLEHLAPYAEAVASGELPEPEEALPDLKKPNEVWSHVFIEYVAVMPLGNKLTVEFGYGVTWDDEHTLGVRFQDGRFVELCGSVLPP